MVESMCRFARIFINSTPRQKSDFLSTVKRCTNYITIVAFNSRAAVDIDVACFSVLTSPSRERVVRTRAQLQGPGKG